MAHFEDCWRRIDRAVVHGKAFIAEWDRIMSPQAYEPKIVMNHDWTSGMVVAEAALPVTNDLALELGEFFYQLRAALDAAVYRVKVLDSGVDPPPHGDQIEFPIYSQESRFRKNVVNLNPFPKELRKWLGSIQPYKKESAAADIAELIGALQLLHDCARKDRHRHLHVVAALPTTLQVEFAVSEGVEIYNIIPVESNLLEQGKPVVAFSVRGVVRGTRATIKLTSAIELELHVNDLPVRDGGNLGDELGRLTKAVRYVVSNIEDGYNGIGFSAHFPSDPSGQTSVI